MKRIAAILISTTLLAACQTNASRIDDALLAELQPTEMATVTQARNAQTSARDAHAKAMRDTAWAEQQVELARSSLKVSRNQVEDSKLAVSLTEKSGTGTELKAAEASYVFTLAGADELRARVALRKREHDHAKLMEKLSAEQLRLANARLELVKAEAVQTLDRVETRDISIKDCRRQVRFHETEVELASIRSKASATELQEARAEYDAVRATAEALRPANR